MAAAVADRVEVAQRLLAAAGPSVAQLVAATNRYGQVSPYDCSPQAAAAAAAAAGEQQALMAQSRCVCGKSLCCTAWTRPVQPACQEAAAPVQTALHLAARRGCMPMLRLLLGACGRRGVRALRWRDASGDTPAQLAHKKGHPAIEAEIAHFLQAMRLGPARAKPHQQLRPA